MKSQICTLCGSESFSGILCSKREFFHCQRCDLVFLSPHLFLSAAEEKARYEKHNNDVTDPQYQKFSMPLVDLISHRMPTSARGLDFGAGTGPVLSAMLEARGYRIDKYDPFFWPNERLEENRYDFIFSCEVVEHFHNPQKEFLLFKKLLKPGGLLAIMSLLKTENTDLATWYYLRDPTHVCAYSAKTFEYIKDAFGFASLEIELPRVVALTAPGSF